MIGSNLQRLENAVLITLADGERPTEAQVKETAEAFRQAFQVADEEFDEMLKRLHAALTIQLDMGTVVAEGYRPWLSARKADIDPYFWERYRKYLMGRMRLAPSVINTLDVVADDILDLSGDPAQEEPFARKGLIVGEVQSGKTATYTALCCKASDAGYRLIILLTGTIESLRRQTQERLDLGFTGRDSLPLLQRTSTIKPDLVIGAGEYDRRRFIPVFTSRARDFSIQTARALNFSIANSKDTILLVCKKNPRVMQNLREWLERYNADSNGRISAPLLLIDDEADNASINTNSRDAENATRTNSEIRQLLKIFEHSTYIGVTATPFANVFIHPESDNAMLGDDLFPKDFIYSLESPTNYIGPNAIFEDSPDQFIREFADMEAYLPLKHKITDRIEALPESLKQALCAFLLATTIRDLRNEGPTHRSMLVNVSRFTALQDSVVSLIHGELDTIKRDVRMYGALPVSSACSQSGYINEMRRLWSIEFDSGEFTWNQVQNALHSSIEPVVVRAVNQRAGASGVDYSAFRETGLRVIAVGGNSLSRGLTLEGLSTSYFHRNSQMYDTLLQMGRWFGYRTGYDDLVRIWMTHDAATWYAHITLATRELRDELKRMRRLKMTPKEFGLKVRSHPDSLIVTARNKMRAAADYVHLVSVSGEGFETTVLRNDCEINQQNFSLTADFIRSLGTCGTGRRGWPVWPSVPKEAVATYLRAFLSDALNFNMQMDAIADLAESCADPGLAAWDVAIVSPRSSEAGRYQIGSIDVNLSFRRVTTPRGSIFISGSKRRVGSPEDESEGLTDQLVSEARQIASSRNFASVPGKVYREVRQRPLLLIYLIRGGVYRGQRASDGVDPFWPNDVPLVALGLSFPIFDDSSPGNKAKYKINVVEHLHLFGDELSDDDDLDEDIEIGA